MTDSGYYSSTLAVVRITSSIGEYVVDLCDAETDGDPWAPDASQTEDMNRDNGGYHFNSSHKAHPVTQMSWTRTGAGGWNAVAVRVAP